MAAIRHLGRVIVHSTRLFSESRLVRLFSRPRLPQHPSPLRPSNFRTRFSLPVTHALSRPFSPPRLPKPPVVPANVTQLGLGTARAFHSGRPVFQNMIDNVPIATRALWEAEWDVKMKKKEARRSRRAAQNKPVPKSRQILKPNPAPLSELDVYFPVEPAPSVTTHLLVPLAPTPSAHIPLSCRSDGPILPISHLAHIHTNHHLHSLRVSTLFARLDTENVWDDPGVNVDAYAFGPRHDTHEKQCTILRVSFRGWSAARVRAILGDTTEEWYSLQETLADHPPCLAHLNHAIQEARSESPPPQSLEPVPSEIASDDETHLLSPLPIRASASAQHDLVLPTLDFSSVFSDAAHTLSPPPQPVMFLRTISDLTRDAELPPSTLFSAHSSPTHLSRDYLGLSSSFLNHVEENK